MRNIDGKKSKRFRAGLQQLAEEGVVRPLTATLVDRERIIGVVGDARACQLARVQG